MSRITRHINPTSILALVALVFAVTGGAYAAGNSGGANNGGSRASATAANATAVASKAKHKPKAKTGPRGPAGPAGKNGANGAPGATGPAGPAGPTGPTGPVGATGATGNTGETGATGKEGEKGKEGKQGKEGSPWTDKGVLPSGSTETGVWSVRRNDNAENEIVTAPISFPIQLESAPEGSEYVAVDGTNSNCSGTAEAPVAAPGYLCVYEGEAGFLHKPGLRPFEFPITGTAGLPVGTTGAQVVLLTNEPTTVGEETSAEGTFAVTAK